MKKKIIVLVAILLLFRACFALAKDIIDVGGYYYPKSDIVISGFRFESFSLENVTYYSNGGLNYEHPKPIGPNGSLMLVRVRGNQKHRYFFTKSRIDKDVVVLSSAVTPIGNIEINGKFLDTRGMFWNRADVKPLVTPVFQGTLTVLRNGKPVFSKVSTYVFWEGD